MGGGSGVRSSARLQGAGAGCGSEGVDVTSAGSSEGMAGWRGAQLIYSSGGPMESGPSCSEVAVTKCCALHDDIFFRMIFYIFSKRASKGGSDNIFEIFFLLEFFTTTI